MFRQGCALLIGVGTYKEPIEAAPRTSADARELGSVLTSEKYCGYDENRVEVLSDARAGREQILKKLDDLAHEITSSDTFVLFYSGHGDYGGDDIYYLTCYDTQVARGKIVPGTGISQDDLALKLAQIKAERVLIILNACHSGEVAPVLDIRPVPNLAVDALLSTGTGRIIITACKENQYSFQGRGKCTIFGQSVADAFRGVGLGAGKSYINASDLYESVYDRVSVEVPKQVDIATRQKYGDKQEPELSIIKQTGRFAVALYNGEIGLGAGSVADNHTPLPLPDATSDVLDTIPGRAVRVISQEQAQQAYERIVVKAGRDAYQTSVQVGRDNNRATGGGVIVSGTSGSISTGSGIHVAGDVHGSVFPGSFAAPVFVAQGDLSISDPDLPQADRSGETEAAREGRRRLARTFAEAQRQVRTLPADDQEVVAPLVTQVQINAEKLQEGDSTLETVNAFEKRLRSLTLLAPEVAATLITSITSSTGGISAILVDAAERANIGK